MLKTVLIFIFCFSGFQLKALVESHPLELNSIYAINKEGPPPKAHKFLLITGCARSGTTYIADVLQSCGLDIGHEVMGRDGCSSWFMCVEAKKFPWKNRPSAYRIHFDHIFHQVRNPLDVISSVYATEHPKALKFFSENIPQINAEDAPLVKCAKYWYYWNLYAERKSEWRYQVEQIDTALDEMSVRLGIYLDKKVLKTISRSTNHRDRPVKITWTQLRAEIPSNLFSKIQKMALRYGYSIES